MLDLLNMTCSSVSGCSGGDSGYDELVSRASQKTTRVWQRPVPEMASMDSNVYGEDYHDAM